MGDRMMPCEEYVAGGCPRGGAALEKIERLQADTASLRKALTPEGASNVFINEAMAAMLLERGERIKELEVALTACAESLVHCKWNGMASDGSTAMEKAHAAIPALATKGDDRSKD